MTTAMTTAACPALPPAVRPTPRSDTRRDASPDASPGGRDVAGRPGRRPEGHAGTHPAGTHPAVIRPAATHPVGRTGARAAGAPPHSLRDLAMAFAILYLEVESGRRPPRHATLLMEPRLAAQLEQLWVRPGEPGRVIAVTSQRTAQDAFEAVAVVRRGRRTGALALRMTRRAGRWLVAEAIRPEDGPLPEPPYGFPSDGADAFDLAGAHGAVCGETGQPPGIPLAL